MRRKMAQVIRWIGENSGIINHIRGCVHVPHGGGQEKTLANGVAVLYPSNEFRNGAIVIPVGQTEDRSVARPFGGPR